MTSRSHLVRAYAHRVLIALGLFCCVAMIAPRSATAQSRPDVTQTITSSSALDARRDRPEPPSYGELLFKMVVGMLAITLLAYVVIRFGLARFLPQHKGNSKMEVVARQVIEPKRALLVVRVASKHLLLSSSEQGIHFLTELSDEDAEQLSGAHEAREPKPTKRAIPKVFTLELEDPVEGES